jgi:hypothetical protein
MHAYRFFLECGIRRTHLLEYAECVAMRKAKMPQSAAFVCADNRFRFD